MATIKERITKPTAMAQGRVAHLIEWKGWGGGGEATGSGVGWSAARGRCGGGWGGTALHEDEQFYSQMTDEIKEARFAAGETDETVSMEGTNRVGGETLTSPRASSLFDWLFADRALTKKKSITPTETCQGSDSNLEHCFSFFSIYIVL